MNRRILFVLMATLVSSCTSHSSHLQTTAPPIWRGTPALAFERNSGQMPSVYGAVLRASRFDAAFHRAGVLFALKDPAAPASPPAKVALTFTGAQLVEPVMLAPLPGKVNYLRGTNPRAWTTGVPTFGRVQYPQLYPGIDLVFYGNEQRLEYDFVVAAQADPLRITLNFEGTGPLRITPEGDLAIGSDGQAMIQRRPTAYQERDGRRVPVDAAYVLTANRMVTLQLGAYDRSMPLTIDPMIVLSTYFGGTGGEFHPQLVRQGDSLYLAGLTCSADFPVLHALQSTRAGDCDGFLTRLSGDGTSMVYSTYFGGSSTDYITGLAVDASGAAYISGYTASPDLPTTAGAFDRTCGDDGRCQGPLQVEGDAFVAKIAADGSTLVYSTYVGGAGTEIVTSLAVNSAGQAMITGSTTSTDYPTTAGAVSHTLGNIRDAIVTKVSADGSSLVYSSYFGGNGSDDVGTGITFDPSGNAYVVGESNSSNLPVVGGFQATSGSPGIVDGFILKLTPGGSIAFSTYFGGNGQDEALGVAFDTTGLYVGGVTTSTTIPGSSMSGTSEGTAFVAQVASDGSHVVKTQLIDGNHLDRAGQIVITRTESRPIINVVGDTNSTNFPVTADAFQKVLASGGNGSGDLFFATLPLEAGGTLAAPTFASYLGGPNFESEHAMTSDGVDGIFLVTSTSGAFPRINANSPTSASDKIAIVHIVPPARWTESTPGEVHLYADDATAVGSEWSLAAPRSSRRRSRARRVMWSSRSTRTGAPRIGSGSAASRRAIPTATTPSTRSSRTASMPRAARCGESAPRLRHRSSSRTAVDAACTGGDGAKTATAPAFSGRSCGSRRPAHTPSGSRRGRTGSRSIRSSCRACSTSDRRPA
jgi:hypothetical protein